MQRCVSSIVKMAFTSRISKAKDKFCYDMYNAVQNEGDFDYLRKVDQYEYPAKIRFVPLIRPKLEILRSEETKRPFNWRVYTIDEKSIDDKNEKRFQAVIAKMASNMKQRSMAYEQALDQISLIEEQLNMARQQAQEQGVPVPPEMEMQLRAAQRELDMGKFMLNQENVLNEEDVQDITKHFKLKYKDFMEIMAEKGIKYLIATQSLKDTFNLGFEDKLVVDKEYYYVDWESTMNNPDPVIRKVNPMSFYYAGDSQVEWVGEAEWCMEERFMTVNQIIDEYGDKLSHTDLEKLRSRASYINTHTGYGYGYYGYNYSANGTEHGTNSVDGCGPDTLYAGSEDFANVIRVATCFWQSPTKMRFKKSPNPNPPEGRYFTHAMNDDDTIREDKGEKEVVGYKNDVYQGVLIDTNIYVDLRKKEVVRSQDNYGRVELPYVGRAHNYYTRRPYSLVWAAKDIQILYNIIHYHKELWIALSGVKGFIMDKSQKPEGMSMKEWMYQRKMGVAWIQSVRSGLNRQPSFNQFQNYDDSLGQGYNMLLLTLEHLERLAGRVLGIPDSRMGEIVSTDQVGTTKQSIAQSSLITEIIFYDHEKTKRRVLNRAINLCKNAWKEGKQGAFIYGQFEQELLNIPKDTMNRADYLVFTSDSGKEQKALDEIKGMAFQKHAEGAITFSGLVKLYNTDNLRDLEAKIQQYEEIAIKRAEASEARKHEYDKELKQMDNDLKMMLDKQSEDVKMMQAQLDQAKFKFDQQAFNMEQQLEKYKIDRQYGSADHKTDTEATVEREYLNQQKVEAAQEFAMERSDLAMRGVEATESSIKQSAGDKERVKD